MISSPHDKELQPCEVMDVNETSLFFAVSPWMVTNGKLPEVSQHGRGEAGFLHQS